MRELAKSFARLGWAMSVFGVQQVGSLLESKEKDESQSRSERVGEAMDALSHDTERHFEKRAKSLYEAGDRFQSELFDLFFDTADSEELRPKRVIERAADFVDKSADKLREWSEEGEAEASGGERQREAGESES